MILTIQTRQKKQVVDITEALQKYIRVRSFTDGLCNVFVEHTTAAVSTVDLDPGTDLDYLDALDAIIPHITYRHPHNPEHFPDHLLATLVGPSLTVPIHQGELQLGVWQRIALFEFDGPRPRHVFLTLL